MDKPLKIVFLGTPDFAVGCLDALHHSKHEIVAVVTMPDKKMGRGKKLQGSDVKQYADKHALPILQPEKLKNPEFIAKLKSYNADIFAVVAFRMLPEVVWNMPPLGTVNVHGSLLPQYRGAAPINWAIINGEHETGVTIFKLKHEIDTGDILLRKSTSIGINDNAQTIHDKLMNLGASALVEAMDMISEGNPTYLPQLSDEDLKPAPKIFKEDCRINWNQDVKSIHNFIRGLSPYPAAWSQFISGGSEFNFKFFKSSFVLEENTKPSTIETDGKTFIKIAGNNGWVFIEEIQIPGKKRMQVADLLRGFQLDKDLLG